MFEYEIELYDEYIKLQDVLDVVDQSNISMYDTQDKFEFKVSSVEIRVQYGFRRNSGSEHNSKDRCLIFSCNAPNVCPYPIKPIYPIENI